MPVVFTLAYAAIGIREFAIGAGPCQTAVLHARVVGFGRELARTALMRWSAAGDFLKCINISPTVGVRSCTQLAGIVDGGVLPCTGGASFGSQL